MMARDAPTGPRDAAHLAARSSQQEFQRLVLACNKEGMDFLRKAQYKPAFEQLKYAEALLVAREGEEEPTNLLAVTCNNLGCYYKKVGKLHAALSYLRKALKIEVSLQTDDVTVAGTHLNICAILSKLDKHDKAVQHALCALELISHRVESSADASSPDEYSVLAIAYHNVAVERDYMHQWEQAAAAYRQGHEVAKKCLGDQHPLTQTLGKNLEAAMQKSQKFGCKDRSSAGTISGRQRAAKTSTSFDAGHAAPTAREQEAETATPVLPEIQGVQRLSSPGRGQSPMPIPASSVIQETVDWAQQEEATLRASQGTPARNHTTDVSQLESPGPAPLLGHRRIASPMGPTQGAPCSLQGAGLQQSQGPHGPQGPWQGPATHWPGTSSPLRPPPPLEETTPSGCHGETRSTPDPPPLVVMGSTHSMDRQRSHRTRDEQASHEPQEPGRSRSEQSCKAEVVPCPPVEPPRVAGRPCRSGPAARARREAARAGRVAHWDNEREEAAAKVQSSGVNRKRAAVTIQRAWRAFRKRKRELEARAELERISATRIQARWRAFHVVRSNHNRRATIIQKWARGHLVRLSCRRNKASTTIQRHAAGHLARKKIRTEQLACTKMQRMVRGKQARQKVAALRQDRSKAALVIQRSTRSWRVSRTAWLEAKAIEAEQEQNGAAETIQRVFRGSAGRRKAKQARHEMQLEFERREAARHIAGAIRTDEARRQVQAMQFVRRDKMHQAATVIRKYWLRRLYSTRYRRLKSEFRTHESSVVTLQRFTRGFLVRLRMWRDAIRSEEELWAAVEIQRCWRGHVGRVRWELAYEWVWSREAAARRLQRFIRGWLARTRVYRMRKRLARAEFEKARRRFKAAQKIQALVRGVIARRKVVEYKGLKVQAVLAIQRVFRGHRFRCALWEQVRDKRATQIQAWARGRLIRNRRLGILARVILIQRTYRLWLRFTPEEERQRKLAARFRRKSTD